jgi:glycosyltransferase involved in cell wall biosynthesis
VVKVLTVIDSLEAGLAGQLLATLVKAASAEQLELEVASLQSASGNPDTIQRRLEEVGIKASFLGIRRISDLRSVQRVADAIRSSQCEVVHAYHLYSSTLVPVAARLAARPSVCTLYSLPQHGNGREALKERLCIAAAGRSSALIFVSEAALQQFAARYRRRPSWRVLRNGLDVKTWSPGPGRLPHNLRIPNGAPVVSITGALRATKGHALAIAAWHSVLSRVPEARLLIVGDGPERATLRRQAQRAGLQHRVVFAGRIDDEWKRVDIVRASDVALLPSYGEALPMALIEASACARPVIATNVGGVQEVVSDGGSGKLIPPGEITAIADAVIELLQDSQLRARMGQAGRSLVERRFDMYEWARRLVDSRIHTLKRRLVRMRMSLGAAEALCLSMSRCAQEASGIRVS